MGEPRRDPIIILGCMQSGMSLVCQILEKIGVRFESEVEERYEHPLYVQTNEYLLRTLKRGTWDKPPRTPGWSVDEIESCRDEVLDDLGTNMSPWAFKDPRNTFTWSAWAHLYPDARFVIVRRHPMDIVASLVTRERAKSDRLLDMPWDQQNLEADLTVRPLKSLWCCDYVGAWGTWRRYEQELRRAERMIQDRRLVTVFYEELCENPMSTIAELIDTLDLSTNSTIAEEASKMPSKDRVFAFSSSPRQWIQWERFKGDPVLESDIEEYRNVEPNHDGAMNESSFFRELPEPARALANRAFSFGVYQGNGCPPVRSAKLPSGIVVSDPVGVSDHPQVHQLMTSLVPPAIFHRARLNEFLLNLPTLGCGLKRNQHYGQPAYIVGNGPSAHLAREWIPRREDGRRGVVFAINRGFTDFVGDLDYWFCGDALWDRGQTEWKRDLLNDWTSWDPEGAEAMFCAYTSHDITSWFADQRGHDACHYYHGAYRSIYRDLTDPEVNDTLPTLIEGIQSAITVVHLAQWLGCAPIVLFGIDKSNPVEAETYHCHGDVGWRPESGEDDMKIMEGIGVNGQDVEIHEAQFAAAGILSGMSMFLQDSGIPIFNCSEGVDFLFAPHFHPSVIVPEAEGQVVVATD